MRLALAVLLAVVVLAPLAVALLQRAPWSLRAEFDRVAGLAPVVHARGPELDRSMSSDGRTFERHPWSTPLREHATFEGGRVARRGQAAWGLPEGEFTYGEFVLESLRTDPAPALAPARGG